MRLGKFWLSSFALVLLSAAGIAAGQDNGVALAGVWQGSYVPKADPKAGPGASGATRSRELGSKGGTMRLPVTVMIGAGADGKLTGMWNTTAGKQAVSVPIEIAMDAGVIRFTMAGPPPASWEGKLSADGSTLDGKWQGKGFGGDQTAPLVLKRQK
ncbi:MAG TPA: hypothetical protein VFX89_20700 [Gammaproteobacteria bacterium]|nr:hypothetical protein [Gammaproteobacteria bacterium]